MRGPGVYYICPAPALETRVVKIGKSISGPDGRRSRLQTGNQRLLVVHWWERTEGDPTTWENLRHEQFSHYRICGTARKPSEWFHLEGELLDFLSQHAVVPLGSPDPAPSLVSAVRSPDAPDGTCGVLESCYPYEAACPLPEDGCKWHGWSLSERVALPEPPPPKRPPQRLALWRIDSPDAPICGAPTKWGYPCQRKGPARCHHHRGVQVSPTESAA